MTASRRRPCPKPGCSTMRLMPRSTCSHDRLFLREHASWALAARLPRLDAIGRLVAVVTGGGFSGMLAQRTLGQWARSAADHVALALEGAIAVQCRPTRPGPGWWRPSVSFRETWPNAPWCESAPIRVKRRPCGRRPSPHSVIVAAEARRPELIRRLSDGTSWGGRGPAGRDRRRPAPTTATEPDRAGRLAVAQLFLHADIDRELTSAGIGDNGGVATLLLRLGDALAAHPELGPVLTLSRGSASDSYAALTSPAGFERGHLLPGGSAVTHAHRRLGRLAGPDRRRARDPGGCSPLAIPVDVLHRGWPTWAAWPPTRWPRNSASRRSSPSLPTRTRGSTRWT